MAVNMTLHRWPRLGAVTAKRLNHPRKERKLQKAALIRRVMIAPCRIIIVGQVKSASERLQDMVGASKRLKHPEIIVGNRTST